MPLTLMGIVLILISLRQMMFERKMIGHSRQFIKALETMALDNEVKELFKKSAEGSIETTKAMFPTLALTLCLGVYMIYLGLTQ